MHQTQSLFHVRLRLSCGFIWQISSVLYNTSTVTIQKCFIKDFAHTATGWVTMKKSLSCFQLNK